MPFSLPGPRGERQGMSALRDEIPPSEQIPERGLYLHRSVHLWRLWAQTSKRCAEYSTKIHLIELHLCRELAKTLQRCQRQLTFSSQHRSIHFRLHKSCRFFGKLFSGRYKLVAPKLLSINDIVIVCSPKTRNNQCLSD